MLLKWFTQSERKLSFWGFHHNFEFSTWQSYASIRVWIQKGFSSLGITELAELWGGITGSHLKTWEEPLFVKIFVHCSFLFLWGDCLPDQVNKGILVAFLEKINFQFKAQHWLLLTTVYSSRLSCFAVFHSINRQEFTNGQCGKQDWFWFSDISPTRNSKCRKTRWGFRFLGPLLILGNVIPNSMINYCIFMVIHSLADKSNDREDQNT